jgi:hypothetical protein
MAERCHTTAIDTSQEVWALQWVILYRYTLGILVPHEGKRLTPSWPHIVNASDKVAAAGLVIDYWPNNINIAVWVTIMLVVIIGLNFMPVRFYGETEFWFAGTKVILLVGLLMLSFILFWGRWTTAKWCPDFPLLEATRSGQHLSCRRRYWPLRSVLGELWCFLSPHSHSLPNCWWLRAARWSHRAGTCPKHRNATSIG